MIPKKEVNMNKQVEFCFDCGAGLGVKANETVPRRRSDWVTFTPGSC